LLLKELIASPAPARSQDFFGLLHFEFAFAFHFSVSGFTHERTSISSSYINFLAGSSTSKPGDKTKMTVTEYGWTAGQMFDYSLAGSNQSLDKMAASFARS